MLASAHRLWQTAVTCPSGVAFSSSALSFVMCLIFPGALVWDTVWVKSLDVLWVLSVLTSTSLFLVISLLSRLLWKSPPLKWRSCRVEGSGQDIGSYISCHILGGCWVMPSLSPPVAVIWVTSVFCLHPQVESLLGWKLSCVGGLCSPIGPLWVVQGEAEIYFILVQWHKS